MATKLYLRDTTVNGISGYRDLIATAGSSVLTGVVNTAASGTNIQWTKTAGGTAMAWISGRIPAGGVTLTAADWDIWCQESAAQANAVLRFRIYKYSGGSETELTGSPFDEAQEMNSMAMTNETGTANFTDTAFAENDRIVVKLFITNVGTMATGYTCTLNYDAADGQTGDSAVNLAETITFKEATDPSYMRTIADTITFSDSPTKATTFARTIADTITFSDNLTKVNSKFKTIEDTITFSDSPAKVMSFAKTIADTITFSDNLSRVASYERTLTDTITFSEELTSQLTVYMTPLEKIQSLQFSMTGAPWVRIAPKDTQATQVDGLAYSNDGSPWWGHHPEALTWAIKTIKAYIGGVWITKPLKWFNGSIWTAKDIKKYG